MAELGFEGIGAWILGRNMFGPVRGPWPDESWKGWWGEEPPYHTPVYVLTHYPRAPLTMAGGTEFRFVTDGSNPLWRKRAMLQEPVTCAWVAASRRFASNLSAGLVDDCTWRSGPSCSGPANTF
jgi:dihydrofolate reductase